MRKPVNGRTIGVGLVGAHLLLAGTAAILVMASPRGPSPNESLFATTLAISIGQASLIGLWVGLAKAPMARRLPSAIGGGAAVYIVLTFAVLTGKGVETSSSEDWVFPAVFVLGPLVAVGLLAAAMRRRRFAVERFAPGEDRGERRDVQFSLFQLFAITFVAAILFTLVRQLRGRLPGPSGIPWELVCLVAAFNALMFALHTLICLWSALCAGRRVARLGALLFSTALAGAVYGFAMSSRPDEYQIWIELMSAYSIVTAGSLLLLRWFGYRLTRQAPAHGERGALAPR